MKNYFQKAFKCYGSVLTLYCPLKFIKTIHLISVHGMPLVSVDFVLKINISLTTRSTTNYTTMDS